MRTKIHAIASTGRLPRPRRWKRSDMVLTRSAPGRRLLEHLGDRAARRELAPKFGPAKPDVGALQV
ncbi:hypothetical protein RCF27_08045 [Rhodococcus pyridinivorans]|uniref:Uncharacterized protein n=2 Tax=Rhodococcus TaxID=1827 RepID=A0A7M2XRC5_9NOCA|nr:hypothetical protein [Rhodococcus pyridinivorans]QOW00329.1 hypothetical protein INP59_08335 [Rhodococcus pyridinivorans]WMM74233.1 hypothetical protein RCF27_08045 [Rhodococcus pyridinivorans]